MFKPNKGVDQADIKYALIDNSQTLSVGEVIIPGVQTDASVVLTAGGTTGAVLGVVLGIVGAKGKVLELNTVVAENDNVTDKMIRVSYLPAMIPMEYISDLDAAAETTDNSGAFGTFAIDSTGLLVDENTVTAFSTVEDKQVFSYGLTGRNTTEVAVRFISTILGYNIAG
jgi:hypothetical protein